MSVYAYIYIYIYIYMVRGDAVREGGVCAEDLFWDVSHVGIFWGKNLSISLKHFKESL